MSSAIHVIIFIITFQILKSTQFPTVDVNNCKTPDGELGNCVRIKECQFMRTYILEAKNISIENQRNFLNEYICDYVGKYPKVCCPKESIVNNLQDNLIQLKGFDPTSNEIFHKNLKLLPRKCGMTKNRNVATLEPSAAQKATINEFPWMVLLSGSTGRGPVFQCVGTIVNERYILTAANCLKEKLISIRVGEYNISSSQNLPTQAIKIEKQIKHEEFSRSTQHNDIALLRLSKPLDIYSENVKAICLPLQNHEDTMIAANTPFILTGWGLSKKKFKNELLLQGKVSTITQEQCRQYYKKELNRDVSILNKQFCFYGGWNGKSDPCNSDTGSPVQKLNGIRYTQYGIVSISSKFCGNKVPVINTRIDQYINWILDNIEP